MMPLIFVNRHCSSEFSCRVNLFNRLFKLFVRNSKILFRFSERWIDKLIKSTNWNPCLNTVLRISEALKISVIQFVEFAETREIHKRSYHSVRITPTRISSTLKTIRLQKELSQSDLAKLTDFQLSSISLRENERHQNYPTLSTLEVYCKAYTISVSSFLLFANEIPQKNFQEVSV